jgi:bla regulator protein BlaR1
MANDLLRLTLCTSLALLLLLVIRTPLRRVLGAVLAYQAWSIVPFITIAACWPNSAAPALHAVATMQVVRALAVQMLPAPSVQIDVLLFLWAGGALPVAAWFVIAHWLFRRRAGPLQRQGNLYFSDGNAGPASVGLLAPIIIVPHDFAQRYTAAGQVLVIAHEQAHIARGDAWANLLQAAFQCVFWFNPLVHLAALRFRQDQELSCDAIVMTQHPHQRRSYAEALLASHRVPLAPQSGIHCHWQSRHPIKERFMQLQSIPPGFPRRLAGRCLVGRQRCLRHTGRARRRKGCDVFRGHDDRCRRHAFVATRAGAGRRTIHDCDRSMARRHDRAGGETGWNRVGGQ